MTAEKMIAMIAERDGPVGRMIFNNPARHNAVSGEMWDAAADILDGFAADRDIRVVVLTGAGGKDPDDRDLETCERMVDRCSASEDYIEGRRAFMEKRKPVFVGR